MADASTFDLVATISVFIASCFIATESWVDTTLGVIPSEAARAAPCELRRRGAGLSDTVGRRKYVGKFFFTLALASAVRDIHQFTTASLSSNVLHDLIRHGGNTLSAFLVVLPPFSFIVTTLNTSRRHWLSDHLVELISSSNNGTLLHTQSMLRRPSKRKPWGRRLLSLNGGSFSPTTRTLLTTPSAAAANTKRPGGFGETWGTATGDGVLVIAFIMVVVLMERHLHHCQFCLATVLNACNIFVTGRKQRVEHTLVERPTGRILEFHKFSPASAKIASIRGSVQVWPIFGRVPRFLNWSGD